MIEAVAPCKVNLCLHVTGRRADGFHFLQSLVVFCQFGDRLHITPSDTLSLRVTGAFSQALGPQHDNLVLRAARALQQACGTSKGAAITLEKRVPVGAGLGGGSADAAATLKSLLALWQETLPPAQLMALAAQLGSDVPACLSAQPLWMGGVGEQLQPLVAMPRFWLVLANPSQPLLTADVYRALTPPFSPTIATPPGWKNRADCLAFLRDTRNDLLAPALSLMPEIATVLAALEAQPGCVLARLSGSGPTCFGLFTEEEAAARASAALAGLHSGWWIQLTLTEHIHEA
jgi:4-diphosphocytidyl-2-C-methyl-D-erythritol kinase